MYLILPAKLHVCYDLPQKALLLLCFLEKRIRNYDDSNKNNDATSSLPSHSEIPKAV